MSMDFLEIRQSASQVVSSHVLAPPQISGIKALVVVSFFSLVFVLVLLSILALSAIREYYYMTGDAIIRSHVAAYFISLLITDLFQAIGSIMNIRWVQRMAVDTGAFCTAQGVFKQAADVGTATWVLVIAIHTFNVLVLRIHVPQPVMYIALVGGWCLIGVVVSVGPSFLETAKKGPYFDISGYWCWISDKYEVEQITLDYLFMFISAFFSFVLYTLVFLRLRGNLVYVPGRRIQIRFIAKDSAWSTHQSHETPAFHGHLISVARHMLLYPIAYTIMIVPIAAVRFSEWAGHPVPFVPVIFSDSVFLLSGLVNATLFVTTGRILSYGKILSIFRRPAPTAPTRTRNTSRKTNSNKSWGSCAPLRISAAINFSVQKSDNEKSLPEIPVSAASTTANFVAGADPPLHSYLTF